MSELTDLLYELTGIAMKLQTELGRYHQEEVYHRMLRTRLEKNGYVVFSRPKIVLLDDNKNVVKAFYPDLRVKTQNFSVLIEIKSDPKGIQVSDKRQAQSYLSISPMDEAILILNFATNPFGQDRAYQRRVLN